MTARCLIISKEPQEELIEKLTKDFPSSLGTNEYSAYKESPTVGNATGYISATIEDNLSSIINSPTYADYIATRPRAERIGSHGLFSSGDEPIVLSKVSEELNNHQSLHWPLEHQYYGKYLCACGQRKQAGKRKDHR